ncbi:uncharacterized protein LOC130716894 isoform X1 [Lotus japonicus]|uniref:uncharacterized protein LOC130716894 isoform X1 n=1 Tax=Lotus japonicus TaxID=34305 RepID=UPI002585DD1C|nr:uncharacterized protein LOC130716894 isoform X1 [Lotus japonicus]
MESSSRRPFDRSREPGLKRPRMMEEPERVAAAQNPSSRQFLPQRQQQVAASGISTLSSAARLRAAANSRDLESSDFGRGDGGGGYHPRPPPFQELVAQYKSALAELTFNSKPIITNLTIIAGENQAAEQAIAATVCANIIEVPSEQKLPSLYLLDSIVKNIGRGYVKYFAARLPEVFCKAYRHVDPAVHHSMRHLFGTWRGVFPSQTLQAIEKELGFTPAVNGSSSTSATLRSDSQSQRPPPSIHVNPKYLERQRLQQSSRTKGVDDMSGAIANSNDDPEMPDRALGVKRPRADPSVSVHYHLENNQRAHRDAFNDSVREKSISASYGGNEYGSDLSRNLGMGTGRTGGRVAELGSDKSGYNKAAGAGVAGTISGQRNGLSIKNNFLNTEASMILDARNQPRQNINSLQRGVMSNSWKHSEEEEFMWDEMNAGLTGHDAASVPNNLSKDSWTSDDENLEVEDNHHQSRNPFGANVDTEMSIESQATERKQLPAFRPHPSLSWKLQEQHSIDELNQKPGHSDGFVSTLGALPTNTNSAATRMGNRSLLPKATIGLAGNLGQLHSVGDESPSRESSLRQQSPPPVGKFHRSQLRDLQSGSFSSMTFQPSHKQQLGSSHTEVTAKTEKPHLSKVPLPRETEQPTTTRFETAAGKGGKLSNMPITNRLPTSRSLDTGNLPSILGVRPSQSSGSSPAGLIPPVSAIASPPSLGRPKDNSSALPKIPPRRAAQPPRTSALPPASSNLKSAAVQASSSANNALNPIANLLNSLVAKGLISAETETTAKVPSEMLTRLEDQSDSITTSSSLPGASVSGSAVPVPSTKDEVDDGAKTPISLSESTSTEIRNFIGFEFKPDVIRELHPSVISGLFDDFPHHCSICGLKLKFQEQFDRHLEWHATREREHSGLIKASRWYLKSSDWVVGKVESLSENEFADSVDRYGKETDRNQEDAMVLADENQCLCVLCGELFEEFYCQENGEWMFKGAVYVPNSDINDDMGIRDASTGGGPIIHARCLSENPVSSVLNMEQD